MTNSSQQLIGQEAAIVSRGPKKDGWLLRWADLARLRFQLCSKKCRLRSIMVQTHKTKAAPGLRAWSLSGLTCWDSSSTLVSGFSYYVLVACMRLC